jgi:hypothetical protein
MEKMNVESSIHTAIMDGSHPLEVTSRTREMIGIITALRVVYADLNGWLEKHWPSYTETDEAFNAMKPFLEFLEGRLMDSITDNTSSTPFKGI